jgi:hypothetical protein
VPIASARRCLAAVAVVAAVLPATACTGSDDAAAARSAAASASAKAKAKAEAEAARDPLVALADTDSPDYTDDSARPVVHRSGTGPAHFTVRRPDAATAIRFYVSCSPDSRFRVSIGTWFAGPCSTAFQNSGQLPLGPAGQPVTVDLDLPAGVHYWIVGLAVG